MLTPWRTLCGFFVKFWLPAKNEEFFKFSSPKLNLNKRNYVAFRHCCTQSSLVVCRHPQFFRNLASKCVIFCFSDISHARFKRRGLTDIGKVLLDDVPNSIDTRIFGYAISPQESRGLNICPARFCSKAFPISSSFFSTAASMPTSGRASTLKITLG